MTKLKLMAVFGTRPEAIKLAPVILELKKSDEFEVVVVATAQHREMLDQVLRLFQIVPDYDLDIMRERQDPFGVTISGLQGLKYILQKEKPAILLVQGDTTTTFAVTLAGFYLKIPIGHIEAGLRTYDKYHPFPEEKNRQLTSMLADLHFAPTEAARKNLLLEGVRPKNVYVTGNTVIDALLATARDGHGFRHPIFTTIDFETCRTILVTAHRRESWGKPLKNICQAIARIVKIHKDVEIVFSVHLHPRVRETVRSVLEGVERVHLVEPLDYETFIHLMDRCHLILTDSGGIQEEAPSLGKPVLVLREVTERPEAVEMGTARLVGTKTRDIVESTSKLLADPESYKRMAQAVNPYGDGQAARRIVEILRMYLRKKQ